MFYFWVKEVWQLLDSFGLYNDMCGLQRFVSIKGQGFHQMSEK